jgi:hypothetical protein
MKKAVKLIKMKYNQLKKINNKDIKNLNVKQFIIKYFGKKFFNAYDKIAEYKDYHFSDIEYYIKYYDIVDHIPDPYKLLSISWTELIYKLEKTLNKNKIKTNFKVNKINYVQNNKGNYYIINNKYKTKNIISALTLNPLYNILTKSKMNKIKYTDFLGTIPFARIYTYHKNGHNLDEILQRYNIVDNKLEKIIIMSDKILMISYSDNKMLNIFINYTKKIMIKMH